jgi:DNA topoisomerase-2
MKPSQRKVLFCCFKRKLTEEVKVAQLAGYVSEHSAYHHGEASLHGTIINMAQDYCGSNNVNLLVPSGQFGTRLLGGKDAASPRYIFTKLDSLARLVFHKDDDALIKYRDDDGMSIEPHHYVPVIPMILVNGCDGIGKMLASILCVRGPRVFTMIEPRVSTMIEIVTTGSQELVGAHQFQTTIRLMLLRTFVGFSTVTR